MTFGDIIQKSIEAYNKTLELKNPKLLTKTKQEKMKTFEITEEQIKEIALGGGKKKIKEMFPVVFQPKETPEEFFNSIFSKDLTRKVDLEKHPNSHFYFDGETFMLEIEKDGEKIYAWFNYSKIWNPISTKNNWNYAQTQAFFKVRIEEHFKLRDVTPPYKN